MGHFLAGKGQLPPLPPPAAGVCPARGDHCALEGACILLFFKQKVELRWRGRMGTD